MIPNGADSTGSGASGETGLAATVRANAEALLMAVFAGVAGVAGSYAVAGFTIDFVAGPIAGFMARRMPGAVVSFAIVVLGDLGHQLNLLAAIAGAVLLVGLVALGGVVLERRLDVRFAGALATFVGGTAVSFDVTGAPLASTATGGAAAVVIAVDRMLAGEAPSPTATDRRRVLGGAVSALVLVVVGGLFGSRGDPHGATMDADIEVGEDETLDMPVSSLLAEAEEKSLDVEGLEPLVSDSFYEVDINATNPRVDETDWELTVTGVVDEEVSHTYDEIRAMTPENRFVSLRCVGEALNGKKMDNAVWTGVPITDLVEPAGVPDECCVMLRAADGFFEEFPLPALADGFLAYGMNGRLLPQGHGFPARALIPGHWGEINVKWLTEIEILDEEQDGYWEQRGWHGTGPVNTVAKLHVDNRLADGRIEVAGHAYAGTRGIERVEVSTDGGTTWSDATLSEPLSGTDVWRQWVYRYDPPRGTHEVVVRATDGTGTRQPRREARAFPSGATGWVSREISP